MRGVPGFAASFFVIARLWQSHRHWSRRYGIEDAYGTRLSLALVFIVLVYVYPLRMVAELTLAGISGGALTETPIEHHAASRNCRTLYAVFGLGYAVSAAIFLAAAPARAGARRCARTFRSERIRTQTCARAGSRSRHLRSRRRCSHSCCRWDG